MEKLSTGLRITKAGDDAAGLAVSEKMRAQIRGMEQAERNVQDGISMVQTAEGALEEAGNIAQRMRELGVQAGNDTLSDEDRTKVKEELKQLQDEMSKIATETKFNGKELLNAKELWQREKESLEHALAKVREERETLKKLCSQKDAMLESARAQYDQLAQTARELQKIGRQWRDKYMEKKKN